MHEQPKDEMNKILKVLFYVLTTAGVVLMVRLSLPYLAFQPEIDFLRTKIFAYQLWHWRLSFYVHVFTSTFVLIAGMLQFSRYVLLKRTRLHRASGYTYTAIVLLVSGPSGLVMGFYANGGLPARISFVLLATLWLLFTTIAFILALKRQFERHGAWMARSFALALSALTLRAYALSIGLLHLEITPAKAYVLIAWLSWTLNLVVAECWIRCGGVKRLMHQYRPQS